MGFETISLERLFSEINSDHFEGILTQVPLKWNLRLRTCAGRFFPGGRSLLKKYEPRIEVASYLLTEDQGQKHIRNTLAHEMIHLWLWERKRPHGHTTEFWEKMNEIGLPRYNPVPRHRAAKYTYHCPACKKQFKTRKKLGVRACADCCKRNSGGRFDAKYRLSLVVP